MRESLSNSFKWTIKSIVSFILQRLPHSAPSRESSSLTSSWCTFGPISPLAFYTLKSISFHKAQALQYHFLSMNLHQQTLQKVHVSRRCHDVDKLTSWTLLQFSLVAWPVIPRQSSLRLACQWWYSVKDNFSLSFTKTSILNLTEALG
jgi:hypothetical protein